MPFDASDFHRAVAEAVTQKSFAGDAIPLVMSLLRAKQPGGWEQSSYERTRREGIRLDIAAMNEAALLSNTSPLLLKQATDAGIASLSGPDDWYLRERFEKRGLSRRPCAFLPCEQRS